MRGLFSKILLWTLATVATALIAFWAISHALEKRHRGPDNFLARATRFIEDDACRVYEQGGGPALGEYLRRLDSSLPGRHFLTDPAGRDLVDGSDRSDLLRRGQVFPEPLRVSEGHLYMIGVPRQGRYRFVTVVRPFFEPSRLLPYYAAILVVIVLMGATLAVHLAAPLRNLRRVVDRFGRGDLAARAGSTRKDEIGELSRAFDRMADRLRTLLDAERRLLQDVSHELRSPLARLGFAIELARTSDDRGKALDRVQRDVARLTTLVNELIELTRAEGDPAARAVVPVRLDELLRRVVEDCELEAGAKGCRIAFRADGPLSVPGETELLRRAAENVVRNAIRHAPEGTLVEVELGADARSVPLAAFLAVRDFGDGVPEDMREAIFDPFVRIQGDRSRSSGGVGLGLAITRRAVVLHGGRVAARNAGPGLRVTIELPGASRPADVSRPPGEAPPSAAAVEGAGERGAAGGFPEP